MRAAIQGMKNLEVSLDESELCRRCQPHALVVRHADGKEQRTRGVSLEDLRILAEFLEGKTRHEGPMGGESLLKDHEKRLRELLGL
jgi:hypothetical protein